MNFKLKELQEVLFERKGWMPIVASLIIQLIMFAIIFIPFIFIFAFGLGTTNNEEDFLLGLGTIGVLLCLVLLLPLGVYLQAAMYGSLKDSITEGTFGIKKFLKNGLTYFVPVLVYSLFYGIVIFVLAIVLGFLMGIFSLVLPESEILFQIVITFLIGVVAMLGYPIIFLSVVEGNAFDHTKYLYKKHGKEYLIVSLIAAFVMAIPILSMFATIPMMAFGAYVLVLFYDFEETKGNSEELTDVVEEKEDNTINLEKEEE